MSRFDGKVALITGAGSGIGRATSLRFANEGAAVVCADRNVEGAESVAQEILNEQGRAEVLELDVTDEQAVKDSLTFAVDRFGSLDILFNNAGIGAGNWDLTISVNLSGVYYGLNHGAYHMAEHGGGVILNTASIAGLVGLIPFVTMQDVPEPMLNQGIGSYIAAKHGVAGLTKQFAILYGKRGVRVNAIAPGYIATPMTQVIQESESLREFHEGLHPLGRLGEPEEIAAAAAFLASDDASFITGIVLPVDGGYTAR